MMTQLKTWEKIMVALFVLGMIVGGLGVVNQMQVSQNRKDDRARQVCNTTYINKLASALDYHQQANAAYLTADEEYLRAIVRVYREKNADEDRPELLASVADAAEEKLKALHHLEATMKLAPYPKSPRFACSVQ